MRFSLITIALLYLTPAFGGDWQANPEIKHRLVIPEEKPSPSTASEEKWVNSLVMNLKRSGAKPNNLYRFSRSKAKYYINGEEQDNLIFIYRKNTNKYLIANKTYPYSGSFIVDFQKKKIYASGIANVYVPPSRTFGVVIYQKDYGLYGIPVNQSIGNVIFNGRTVTWY